MNAFVVIAILGAIGILVAVLGKKINLRDIWTVISCPNPDAIIKRYGEETKAEKERTEKLKRILAAKRELIQARDVNEDLRKNIATVGTNQIDLADALPSAKLRHGKRD